MSVIRFHLSSILTPSEALSVLTDFGPSRAEVWPSIDAEHFRMHEMGENWAEVTEGTQSAWERARYEWDDSAKTVTITTLDSKVFGAGGGWEFELSPEGDGSRVDIKLTRQPRTISGKMLAALLPLVGPSSLRKSFSGPLKAR
jgi:hypothetical protein